MKKNFLTSALIILLAASSVMAKTLKVTALEDFSTDNPSTEFKIKVNDTQEFFGELLFPQDTVISGSVIEVHQPKRGKRNGFFEFQLNSYYCGGDVIDISAARIEGIVVGYKPINPKAVGFYVAKKATNFIFKGASLGIAFVEGVATAQEGTRIKSGFINMYKDSPFSYLEKGADLNVETGDILVLKIKKLH